MKKKKSLPKPEKKSLFVLLVDLILSLPIDSLIFILKLDKKLSHLSEAVSDSFIEYLRKFEDDQKKLSLFYYLLIIIVYLLIIIAILSPIITNRKIIVVTVSLPLLGIAFAVWIISLYTKHRKE